jgi:uncharacterized BrkB/YihY/UPF0761 family membrane protein
LVGRGHGSTVTVLPDYLYRRFAQGKRFGREITLFTVWYELRWGITLCLLLTVALLTTIFYFHPSTKAVRSCLGFGGNSLATYSEHVKVPLVRRRGQA